MSVMAVGKAIITYVSIIQAPSKSFDTHGIGLLGNSDKICWAVATRSIDMSPDPDAKMTNHLRWPYLSESSAVSEAKRISSEKNILFVPEGMGFVTIRKMGENYEVVELHSSDIQSAEHTLKSHGEYHSRSDANIACKRLENTAKLSCVIPKLQKGADF